MANNSGTAGNPRVALDEVTKKITRGNRTLGIIVAICMIILGILFLAMPLRTDYVVMVIATIGFIVYGVYQIVAYARTPRDYRNGWTLANGIVFILLGIVLLASTPGEMFQTFAFLLGFLALFAGISQCASYGPIRNAGEPGAGWLLASGIINLILGAFLILTPYVAVGALGYVCGIYLIVGGIALFAEACSGRYGTKV